MRKFALFLVAIACTLMLQAPAFSADSDGESSLTWFAVEINVGPNWDESISAYEQPFFKEHSVHLNELRSEGHIIMGARYSAVGLLIFSAESAEDIAALLDEDPSMQAGTFRYDIHPMNVFYPGYVGDEN